MGLRTWRNGESGDVIQKIIEHNFKITGKYLSYQMMCMTTQARKLLTSDYLSEGLIVYDTTLRRWFQFNNLKWEPYEFSPDGCVIEFSTSDWNENSINIPFAEHKKENPVAHLLIKVDSEKYMPVIGGITIDSNSNIILSSDLAFDGKIIIK